MEAKHVIRTILRYHALGVISRTPGTSRCEATLTKMRLTKCFAIFSRTRIIQRRNLPVPFGLCRWKVEHQRCSICKTGSIQLSALNTLLHLPRLLAIPSPFQPFSAGRAGCLRCSLMMNQLPRFGRHTSTHLRERRRGRLGMPDKNPQSSV